jgi:hypothetical protein
VPCFGTNAGAVELPFQHWRRFKEAFAPELVAQAVSDSSITVRKCLDPFGGSGTTALACQFLGVEPIVIEVNPYLSDLIKAKLSVYDADMLASDFGQVVKHALKDKGNPDALFKNAPQTFLEPGLENRWLFDRRIASRLSAWLTAIDSLAAPKHRRLFRVLLGGVLVDLSNVVVSGKGRRYRRGWETKDRNPALADDLFCSAAKRAIVEIHSYAKRPCATYTAFCGDSRVVLQRAISCDLVVSSPPYPNSFDYTDVYNVELWTLGYLKRPESNRKLRTSTLCSHVQISRAFPRPPAGSKRLTRVLKGLISRRADLWDHRIPEMIGGYFRDLGSLINSIRKSLAERGQVWMVVGDSRYSDVQVETAIILSDLLRSSGWRVDHLEDYRSMRSSPQQGGRPELSETLIIFSNR